jgi:hypothetical protein
MSAARVWRVRLPPISRETWEVWKRRTERRLARIERAVERAVALRQVTDKIALNTETLAARLKQPNVASALIRLLFGRDDSDRDG